MRTPLMKGKNIKKYLRQQNLLLNQKSELHSLLKKKSLIKKKLSQLLSVIIVFPLLIY